MKEGKGRGDKKKKKKKNNKYFEERGFVRGKPLKVQAKWLLGVSGKPKRHKSTKRPTRPPRIKSKG